MNLKYKQINKFFSVCILFVLLQSLYSVPAYRAPITVKQPDGTTLVIKLYGDEFFNYRTTTDGYLLIESKTGYLNYAKMDENGRMVDLSVRARDVSKRTNSEKAFISALQPVENLTELDKNALVKRSLASKVASESIQKSFPLKGTPKSIVILVNFTDKSFVIPNPQQAYTDLLNQKGYSANGGTGSARDYFMDNSSGAFQPQFDVYGPYTLPNNTQYYGGNSGSGDQNPRQMIIDACSLASKDGVDFTQYDTDNDGYVDNVFVYYAGYNEAEGASTNTIWPHRWVIGNTSNKFNNKIIYDYACTSELKGTSGSNMCGIGTFVHEFGHVLGLPDLYATNSATHHTLYSWDVMDYGPYNNSGRTPPNYSGYERFFTGWLTPTEIATPKNYTLDTISSSNQVYLVSQTGNHNLNGKSPVPAEFFLFENRQQKGWDKYLPGHGMLVTHVFYNSSTWSGNTVNNVSTNMGVDIVEADGSASNSTCSGDPFPGADGVTAYSPVLRSGKDLGKPLTEIAERNGIISFKFIGGVFPTEIAPVATAATNITQTSFSANWNAVAYVSGYLLDVFTVNGKDTIYFEGFKSKDVGNVLTFSVNGLKYGTTYYYRVKGTDGESTSVNSNVITTQTNVYTFDMFKPIASAATDITSGTFVANWSWPTDILTPERYLLTVFTKVLGLSVDSTTYTFDGSVLPDGCSASAGFTSVADYYGKNAPALYLTANNGYFQTPTFKNKIKSLSFWYRGRNSAASNALLMYSSIDGTHWDLFKTIQPLTTAAGVTVDLSSSEMPESNAVKFVYSKPGTGYISVDDIVIRTQSMTKVPLEAYDSLDVGMVNGFKINGLADSTQYFYYLEAINNGVVTAKSNEILVTTLKSSETGLNEVAVDLKFLKHNGADIEVFTSSDFTKKIEVYNVSGQKLYDKYFTNNVRIPFNTYPKGVYMLKIDGFVKKIIW